MQLGSKRGVVEYTFDPITEEAEPGGSLMSKRPARSTEPVSGQPEVHSETLS